MTKPRSKPGRAAERRGGFYPPAVLAAALALLVAPAADGLSTDKDQPIEVKADTARLDDLEKVSVYSGGVVVTQGSIKMTGDKMTVHHSEENELQRLIMEGRYATYRQLPDGGEAYDQAVAMRMEYYQEKNLILLLRDACIKQGESIVTGQRIEYNTELSRAQVSNQPAAEQTAAARPAAEKQRVQLVLRKDDAEAAPAAAPEIPANLRDDCKIVPEKPPAARRAP